MNERVFGINEFNLEQDMDVDDILVEDPIIFCLIIDSSGSMSDYEKVVPDCIETLKKSIINSKSEDQFSVSVNYFDDSVTLGGYQSIDKVPTDYTTGGMTALYSAIVKAKERLTNADGDGFYDKSVKSGRTPKVIFTVLSDGYNNCGKNTENHAKQTLNEINKMEFITAYIAFGQDAVGIGEKLGFSNVINVKDANEKKLREIFRILSKSAISVSKSANAVLPGSFFEV